MSDQENAVPEAQADDDSRPDLRSVIEAAVEDTAPSSEQPRDENGRFAAKEEGTAEGTEDAPVEASEEAAPAAEEPEPETPAIEAPESWNKDDRDQWASLPDEAKAIIARRETERDEAVNGSLAQYRPFKDAADKWQPYLAQIGTAPEQAFEYLMNVERTLRAGTPAQKQQVVQKIMSDYGISLPNGGQTEQVAQEADPFAQMVQEAIAPFQQRLDQFEGTLTSREHAEQQSQLQAMNAEIQSFAQAKTEAGTPAHPYFEEVANDMTAIAAGFTTRNQTPPPLKELYEQAVWANPSTRTKLLAEQKAGEEREAKARAAEKAKKAAAAGSSITGAPDGASGAVPTGLRETIEAAYQGTI